MTLVIYILLLLFLVMFFFFFFCHFKFTGIKGRKHSALCLLELHIEVRATNGNCFYCFLLTKLLFIGLK